MPTLGKTKVSPSLISTGSIFQGTASYATTASYALNGGTGGGGSSTTVTNWTSSNLTSSVTVSSVAAFNNTGSPILVSPSSENTYLVYQNGVLKWIPIISAALSISNFSLSEVFEEERIVVQQLELSTNTRSEEHTS